MTDPKLEKHLAALRGHRETLACAPDVYGATLPALDAAIAALSQQRAVAEVTDEMVEIVGKQLWRYWGDVKGAAARTYRNKTRKALEDALAALQGESNAP